MTKKSTYKQPIALFLSGILSVATLGYLASVQAQTRSKPTSPKFIKFQDAGQLKLRGDGQPFKPSGLEQAVKPNEGDTRGTPGIMDNRAPMLSRKYPWSAIGRVQGTTADARSYHCTGVLIDENLVLTNAHCVIDPQTSQLSQEIRFLPNVIDGSYKDVAFVEQVVYGTDFQ